MSSPHINEPIQARMYANMLYKVISVAVLPLSGGLLAPPLFLIAAKKRVVSMVVPAVYAVIIYGSVALGALLGNPRNWTGGILAITMITGAVHAAILDVDWKPGHQPCCARSSWLRREVSAREADTTRRLTGLSRQRSFLIRGFMWIACRTSKIRRGTT